MAEALAVAMEGFADTQSPTFGSAVLLNKLATAAQTFTESRGWLLCFPCVLGRWELSCPNFDAFFATALFCCK